MINFTKVIALPILSAGVIGGAALGLAGTASASTAAHVSGTPSYSYSPGVKAHPAAAAIPGVRNHTGVHHVLALRTN